MRVASVVAAPSRRPDLPRMSSVRSGFFFCGMAQEPVEKRFGEVEEAEFGRGVEGELFGEAGDVEAEGGDGLGELEGEVAVAGCVHASWGWGRRSRVRGRRWCGRGRGLRRRRRRSRAGRG